MEDGTTSCFCHCLWKTDLGLVLFAVCRFDSCQKHRQMPLTRSAVEAEAVLNIISSFITIHTRQPRFNRASRFNFKEACLFENDLLTRPHSDLEPDCDLSGCLRRMLKRTFYQDRRGEYMAFVNSKADGWMQRFPRISTRTPPSGGRRLTCHASYDLTKHCQLT